MERDSEPVATAFRGCRSEAGSRSRAGGHVVLVPSGRLDRRGRGACFADRSGSAVDLLRAGIVQRASAFTEYCGANAAPMPELPPVIGAITCDPTGGALLDRAVPRPVRQGEVVGHQLGPLVGVVDDPV